jgi:hypothetical protein
VQLIHLLDGHVEVEKPINAGIGPLGERLMFEVRGGAFAGPRLKGTILPAGGDWVAVGSDGISRLDIRTTLQTDDSAVIYVQALGLMVINDKVREALQTGKAINYGDTYFMHQPRFETGHPQYLWLNAIVAVAELRFGPNFVEYRMFQAAHDGSDRKAI